jgi:DNA-binding FrmR family transcriptional regulator
MLCESERKKVVTRIKRVEGQVAGIRRMIDEEKYCVDVLLQISAVQGALARIGEKVLGAHIETCVSRALASDDEEERQMKIEELMEVFGRYGGSRR